MDRRQDAKIYVFTHKKLNYELPNNKLYEPLEVGAALHSEPIAELRDNTGNEYSRLNSVLAEGTGVLWIRNNHPKELKWIGQCQYRRQLRLEPDTDFNELFKNYDIIMPKPLVMPATLRQQFAACHNENDLNIAKQIVYEDYPEYSGDWLKTIDYGHQIYYSMGTVMRASDYEDYVDFVYGVTQKYYQVIGVKTVEEAHAYVRQTMDPIKLNININRGYFYQGQTFLPERLQTLFVLHNYKKERILEIPYTLMEQSGI